MNGDRMTIDGAEWHSEVVQHWPAGGPSDRPTALDVLFYDPEDHEQWVGNFWIPYEMADLSRERLRALFRDADTRSWRDSEGRYWWIRKFRPETLGPGESNTRLPDGVLSFHRRDSSGAVFSRIVAELPPIGSLSDEELQRLISGDAGRESTRTPSSAPRPATSERRAR